MKTSRLLEPGIWAFAAQRVSTWYPLRRLLTTFIAATKPRHAGLTDDCGDSCRQLTRDGISFLPGFVDGNTMERVRRHLDGLPLRERFAAQRGGFTLDNIPENVHVAEYATEDILKCPDVVTLANHPALIDAAGQYLGCKPTISNLSVWWSLPADGSAQEAENYHRDVDDWRFVKFFLYLSDVDEEAGPHCFVRGSHRSTKFLRIRRISDSEVQASFAATDCLSIHGKAGDAFLEDTFGLHKGQPPRSKRRLLLQVQYSINPIRVYRYKPSSVAHTGPLPDAYVNRLYLK